MADLSMTPERVAQALRSLGKPASAEIVERLIAERERKAPIVTAENLIAILSAERDDPEWRGESIFLDLDDPKAVMIDGRINLFRMAERLTRYLAEQARADHG